MKKNTIISKSKVKLFITFVVAMVIIAFSYYVVTYKPKAATRVGEQQVIECIDNCLKGNIVVYENNRKIPLLGSGSITVSGETIMWGNNSSSANTTFFIDNLPTGISYFSLVNNGKYYALADTKKPTDINLAYNDILIYEGMNHYEEIVVVPIPNQEYETDSNLTNKGSIVPTVSATPQASVYTRGQEAKININSTALSDTKYLQNNPVVYYQFVGGCDSANNTAETWKALDYGKVQKNQTNYTASIPIPSDLAVGLPTLKYIVKSTSVDGSSSYYPANGINSAPVCIGIN